jgi:hypothetical protein
VGGGKSNKLQKHVLSYLHAVVWRHVVVVVSRHFFVCLAGLGKA